MPLSIFLLILLMKSLPHQKCCVLAGFVHLLIAEGRVVRWLDTRNMSQTWQQIKLIHHFLTRSLAGCRLPWLISIPWSALLLHMPPPMMDQSSFLRLRPGFDLFWLEIFFGNSPTILWANQVSWLASPYYFLLASCNHYHHNWAFGCRMISVGVGRQEIDV